MCHIKEPERQIPIYKKVDVVVCGSGPAGLAASVCAARNSVDVLLIERYPFLGGQPTAAFQNWFGGPTDILTGFALEFAERLDDRGGARLLKKYRGQNTRTGVKPLTYHMAVDPEEWKSLAVEILEESGVKVLTNTLAVDAIVDGQKVKGVIIENKSGRQAVLADVVIDATGDADVAARAGCPIDRAPKSGYIMGMVPTICVGGINYKKIEEYAKEHPEEFPSIPVFDGEDMASIQGISGWITLAKEGRATGDLPFEYDRIGIQANIYQVQRGIGYILAAPLSQSLKKGIKYPWRAEDVTKAEFESIKNARKIVAFLRKKVPGFENCFLIATPPTVGAQDSRRIIGEYVLTRDDIRHGRTFYDDVYLITLTWPDVPVTEEGGWMMHPPLEEIDTKWQEAFKMPAFQVIFGVPYRCLIPKGWDGILVAGQTISMTYMAHEPGPCRGQVPCMHSGQAAGTAAALAVKQKVSLRDLDPATLRKMLELQNVNLRKDAVDLSEVREMMKARGREIIYVE